MSKQCDTHYDREVCVDCSRLAGVCDYGHCTDEATHTLTAVLRETDQPTEARPMCGHHAIFAKMLYDMDRYRLDVTTMGEE